MSHHGAGRFAGLRRAVVIALAAGALAPIRLGAVDLPVTGNDDLQARIDDAKGGDVLELATGTYSGFKISGRHFTEQAPLVIRAAAGAKPVVLGRDFEGSLARLTDVSYLVLDGLTFENSNQPIYAESIDHCLFLHLEIRHTGQEAIHIRGASHDIDIRHCRIHDTGHYRDQWCEGIYIGTGNPPFESVSNVWIEGNDISATAHAEGINLKARCYHVTVRGNHIHDLAPGTATQHNEGGIALEAADRAYRPGEDPDIWIEDNEVDHIRFGRWANGLKGSTMGGRMVGNRIHDCEQFGIYLNAYDDGPGTFPTWIWRNTIERCAAGDVGPTTLPVKLADPGVNPNHPQSWYRAGKP